MATYKQILNGFALKSVTKPPHIPDYHLMVGSAEDLAPQPLVIYEKGITKEVTVLVNSTAQLTDKEVTNALTDGTLEVNDFMGNIATIGEGLGGV